MSVGLARMPVNNPTAGGSHREVGLVPVTCQGGEETGDTEP
jgi:hypothetical protein